MSGHNLRQSLVLVAAIAGAAILGREILPRSGGPRDREAPPPRDARETFARTIVPVLDRRCGGCHGVPAADYAALDAEPLNRTLLRWAVDESGRIAGPEQVALAWRRCTETARGGGREFAPLDRRGPAVASQLLRAPLSEALGGYVHPEVFASVEDPDFRALLAWAEAEIAERPAPPALLAPGAETFFADKVVPILERKTCLGSNCHGKLAFNDLKLDPGLAALPGRFTPALHHANRLAMLGDVTRMVNLSGDVEQSKQLKKNVPLEQGGIAHKGGNLFFEKGDPDYLVLKQWLELEKAEAQAAAGAPLGEVRGIVFVRRPRATPERYLEPLAWLPGGDLFLLRDGRETNLTAALHPGGPADVRAADVSFDGKRAVFAMRRAETEPFNVWEVELEGGSARALTFSTDPAVHWLDPVYVPDPGDPEGRDLARADVVALSNRAGETCAVSPDGILGEADGGSAEAIADAQRFERAGTFDGRRLRVLRGANAGEARVIARHEAGRLVADRPFPQPCDATTHYLIESPVRLAPKFDLYRLPRAAAGEERGAFETGARRMTWSPDQARMPHLRSSGEIMATFLRTGWQDGRPFFNGAIFRTHADGSNFHTHGGNRSQYPILADNREAADGLEVRIARDADSWWGGRLLLADHQFGPPVEPHNPLDTLDHPWKHGPPPAPMTKFLPQMVELDPAATPGGVSPGGAWHDAFPMPDGSILASFAPGPVDLHDPAAAPDFDLVRLLPDPAFQSADGLAGGKFRRETVVSTPHAELWPRAVAARLKEPLHKKLKTEPDLLGAPGTHRGLPAYPEGTPAVLQVYDLVLLDAFFEQSTPMGVRHLAADVCPSCGDVTADLDQVRFARIVGLEPRRAGDPRPPRRSVLAEVPVAADGSIHALVPAGVPFDVESLNGDRMALRSPNRWLYALPGEKHTLSIPRALYAQTCGGCHGGLTGAATDVLRRPDIITSASRTQAIWDPASRRKLLPANWSDGRPAPPIAVEFERDVRAILDRRCASCHAGREAAAGLDLTGDRALPGLLRFVNLDDRRALRAPLMEKLLGRELHADGAAAGAQPHPPGAPLTHEERLTLIRWIDLGADR